MISYKINIMVENCKCNGCWELKIIELDILVDFILKSNFVHIILRKQAGLSFKVDILFYRQEKQNAQTKHFAYRETYH